MDNQQLRVWGKHSNVKQNTWYDEEDEVDDQERASRGGYAW